MSRRKAIEVPLSERDFIVGNDELRGYLGGVSDEYLKEYVTGEHLGKDRLIPYHIKGSKINFYLKSAVIRFVKNGGKN